MTSPLASWTAADGTVVALDGSQGVSALRPARGLDGPPVQRTVDQRIGDGGVRVHKRHPPRPFDLTLLVDLNVVSSGDIVRLFQGPGTLTAASGRQLFQVEHEAGLEGVWSVDAGIPGVTNHRKFPISFVADDPWWYGPPIVSSSFGFGAGTAWDAAIGWDAAVPWSGGDSQAITNPGDVASPVLVDLTGAATEVTFSLEGVGGWQTAHALASGERLTVNGSRTDPNVSVGPHLGSIFTGTLGPADWSLLTSGSQLFDLPPGQSELIVGASGTDGSSSWSLFFYPRFYTP